MRKIAWIILLLLFFGHLVFRISSNWDRYLQKLDGPYWEKRYQQSQWVVPHSQNSIGDDGLYAYHGFELVRGGDPTIINPEVPPMGKYLIGVTILVFQNNNVFGLMTGLLTLGLFYSLNLVLFKNRLLAFLPVFIFSFDTLFYEQLAASFLDTFHLSLILLTFLVFLKKRYIVASLILGCVAAVKFSYLAVFVVLAMGLYLALTKNREGLKRFLTSLPLAIGVVLLTYLRYFLLGHTILDFLKVQKYILNFYSTGVKAPLVGMIFPMILFNKWVTWFAGTIKIPEWTVLWPLSFVGSVLSVRLISQKTPMLLCLCWVVMVLAFFFFTPVFPRYLLLLLPFLYNLSIWALSQNTNVKSFFRSFS